MDCDVLYVVSQNFSMTIRMFSILVPYIWIDAPASLEGRCEFMT
jgi:hypothetical protein